MVYLHYRIVLKNEVNLRFTIRLILSEFGKLKDDESTLPCGFEAVSLGCKEKIVTILHNGGQYIWINWVQKQRLHPLDVPSKCVGRHRRVPAIRDRSPRVSEEGANTMYPRRQAAPAIN